MSGLNSTITLRDGNTIPFIGFGPGMYVTHLKWPKHPRTPYGILQRIYNRYHGIPKSRNGYIESIAKAIENGFRLIDYSETYGDYRYIKEGIKQSGVSRNELFLTTRVGNQQQFQGVGRIRESFLRGLETLGIEYFDLLQFHWPVTDIYTDTWLEMRKIRDEGLVKTLGVANCNIHHLEELHRVSGEWPVINQFEIHPLFTQKPLIEYCKQKGITVEAYTAIARYDDRLVRLPILKNIAAKYNKNLIQIVLRWHIQNGVIPIVRSMNPQHQKSNLDIFDFTLSDEEMRLIDSININSRLRYDPDNCDFSIL
jgi:plant-metabolite dehydrogenase